MEEEAQHAYQKKEVSVISDAYAPGVVRNGKDAAFAVFVIIGLIEAISAVLADVVSVLNTCCGDITIIPLFSNKQSAERVLVRARVGTHGGAAVYRGLDMNCDYVLRDGLTISATLSKLGGK